MLSLREEIEDLNELLEFWLESSFLGIDELGVKVVLEIKLCDFVFGIDHSTCIIIPACSSQSGEQIKLWLTSTGLRELRTL